MNTLGNNPANGKEIGNEYSECFEYLAIYRDCFGHGSHFGVGIEEYTTNQEIILCIKKIFELSKYYKDKNDEFSKHFNMMTLVEYIKGREYDKIFDELGKQAREYFIRKLHYQKHLSRDKYTKLMLLENPWDALNTLYCETKRKDIIIEIGKNTPERLKIKVQKVVQDILYDNSIKSYALLSNLADTLKQINILLEINEKEGFGIKLDLYNILINIDRTDKIIINNKDRI